MRFTRPLTAAASLVLAAAFLSTPFNPRALAHPNHAPDGPAAAIEEARKDIEQWSAQAKARPDDLMTLSRLGQSQLALARHTTDHADFAAAEQTFRRMLEVDASTSWAPYGLAYALVGQHRFKEALGFARDAALHEPDEAQVTALIADVHLALGNNAEALVMSERLAEQDLTLESLSRVALARHAMGRLDDATHSMTEALEAGGMLDAEPRAIAWCRSMLGDFALDAADPERAKAEWEGALVLDPACHHARWRLARLQLHRGDHADAVTELRELVAQVPKPVYLATLADALEADGDTEESGTVRARAEAAMKAELDADGLGHLREYAEFLLARAAPGDAPRAVELALRDLNQVRQDPGAFDTAAWALFRAGNIKDAALMADRAILRNPSHAPFMARAGVISIAAGRRLEGRRLLASALQKEAALEPALAAEARRVLESSPPPAPPVAAPSAPPPKP
ncbi:MAG: tetratricopeptide repeat protein [Phycisphaerales bacterium]